MLINNRDQYLIAHNTGLKAATKISGKQQVASKKVDPENLNEHLDATCKFYRDGKEFSQVTSQNKKEPATDSGSSLETSGNKQKKFLLEGRKENLFAVLPESSPYAEGKDAYPTLKKKLFPALDTMEKTIRELGENPTPEEVDRSNVRRLIRAFQPVAEAFEGSYDKKDFKTSMKRIQKLASKFGKFKDVSVVETELKTIYPDGKIPPHIQKKLDEHEKEQKEAFQETYKDFQEKGMAKSLKILRNPEGPGKKKNKKIEKKDGKKIRKNLTALVDDVENKGLIHREPDKFHEGRKSLRKLLNSMNASQDNMGFDKEDVDTMTSLVNVYGIAQDKNIACEWLEQNGFKKEAATMKAQYVVAQEKALTEADKFLKSGTLKRVRKHIEN